MQNEFEKQVQQKMEELKLAPSGPVWQKVEMQIRRKKDRRRILFWLPFAILLLGGSVWFFMDHNTEQHSSDTISRSKEQPKIDEAEAPDRIIHKPQTKTTARETEDSQKNSSSGGSISETPSSIKIPVTSFEPSIQGRVARKEKSTEQNALLITEGFSEKKEETSAEDINNDKTTSINNEDKTGVVDTTSQALPLNTASTVNDSSETKTEVTISKQDSVHADTTLKTKPVLPQKTAAAKWKFSVVVNAGVSGLDRFELFNGQKSLDYAASPSSGNTQSPPPYASYSAPKKPQKGLALSIGFAATKKLGRRSLFSAGLQYNYFSNTNTVGTMVRRDTMFAANYLVSRYYPNVSASSQPYHNHYHFIALPVAINWQLAKNLPLRLQTGFSIQQLIQTNALYFDRSAQVYYHSKSPFNKTQLFSELGISYSIAMNKASLSLGPQLQYGLTRLEKTDARHHLFAYGIRAQLQLNKK